jgi:NADH-quinone oxidoreductase subunit L
LKTAIELILLLPLAGAIFNILLGRQLPRRFVEIVACSVILGSFVAAACAAASYSGPAVVDLGSWFSTFTLHVPITVYLDPLSLSLALMITFVCALIHLYSVGYMSKDPGHVRYFALLNLFVWAMLVLVLAENMLLLYLGWEGVGFCSYALIGFWYKEEKNATAGRKAFILTRIGDVGLGIAIVWMFKLFETLSITHLNQMGHLTAIGVITGLGLLLLLGAMGKSAQAPLMVWLPDAMAGPTPVSAQIHAATMVTAGVYLLMRMFPLIGTSTVVCAAIAATGAFTAFYAATCAIAERDIKRILAYSTISQIGYMVLAVGSGAITAATFHLIIHAFFKALLFLGAGCIITAMHHEQDIFQMGGLKRKMPVVFWTFFAASLCLAGVPPTGGFFSKDGIMAEVWAKGGMFYDTLYVVGMVTVFLTVIYTFRMLFIVFGDRDTPDPSGRKAQPASLRQLPSIMKTTLIPLALLALFGGMFNLPAYLGSGLLDSFMSSLNAAGEHLPQGTELALQAIAAGIVVAAIFVAWRLYGRQNRTAYIARAEQPAKGLTAFLQNGWYADALYFFLFVRPFKRLAEILWQNVDEGVIDDSLDRMAVGLGRTGQRLGRWGDGRVSLYMLSLAAGAMLMIVWFAWEVLL